MQRSFSIKQAFYLAVAFFLFLAVMNFNTRLEEYQRLKRRAREVSAQATQISATQIALQTKMAYAASDQAVQDWAYGEGHLYLPGDHIVVPVEAPGSPPSLQTPPVPTPTPMQNWEIWRELFFGE